MFADTTAANKIKHLIPVLPVYFIIISVFSSFTYFYALDEGTNLIKIILSLLLFISATGVVVCHSFCMWTSPGELLRNNDKKDIELIYSQNKENDPLFCRKCNTPRPERTHHCKICNKCILKMDHHCPWVANCVGLNNQKYFYQFLFYATFADLIAFVCLLSKVLEIDLQAQLDKKQFKTVGEIFYEIREPLIIMFTCLEAFAMTVSIGFLFTMQTRCLLFNFTTIEEKIYKDSKENKWFNSKDKMENFKKVLGDKIHHWFLPISRCQEGYNCPPLSKSDDKSNYLSLTDSSQEFEDIHITLNLND